MTKYSQDPRQLRAAEHFMQLRDADATDEAILAAADWIDESAEQYDLVKDISYFSDICDGIRDAGLWGPEPRPAWHRQLARAATAAPVRWALAASMAAVIVGAPLTLALVKDGPQLAAFSGRYATAVGESRTVALPDGTIVTLGGATSIKVTFGSSTRTVDLSAGEAYFDVAKNPRRPFSVRTRDGSVTALGTVFDVHRYPYRTTVTLRIGRLRAETGQAERGPVAILLPNSQVNISAQSGLSPVRPVNADNLPTWRKGQMRYVDTQLGEIVSDLRRYSPRPIVIDSAALAERRYTGAVNLRARDIEEWLKSLQYTGGVEVTSTGDAIVLRNH